MDKENEIFIGRTAELSFLEKLYNSRNFEMLILHGRRRVGKSYEKWSDVYSFIKNTQIKERLVIIIDEFTYLYSSNPAYDSWLQIAIDTILKKKNIFLNSVGKTHWIFCFWEC